MAPIEVRPIPMDDVSFVDVGQGLLVPEAFTVELSGGDLQAIVTLTVKVEEGIPVCESLLVRRIEGGPAVTAKTIGRIPLAQWVHLLTYERAITSTEAEYWDGVDVDRDRVRSVSIGLAPPVVQRAVKTQLSRRRVTDDLLTRVAATYRDALPTGAPTQAVSKSENVSHSSAARYVSQARARGLLGPTSAGRAGESKKEVR